MDPIIRLECWNSSLKKHSWEKFCWVFDPARIGDDRGDDACRKSGRHGAKFIGWSGAASGKTNPLTIRMNANKTAKANFSDNNADGDLTPPQGYAADQLIFKETFDSPTLDTTRWNPWLGDDQFDRWSNRGALPSPYSGMNCDSNCSDSNQIMYYDPYPYGSGASIDGDHLVGGNGKLAMIAKPGNHFSGLGYSWSSSCVTTYGKTYLPAQGGYVQIRAKMPDSRYGAWAGFWLLSTNGAEMDIQESGYLLGGANVNNVLASNWHGGGSQNVQDTGMDLSADYHTYGVEYLPGQSWKVYLDGQLMATWTSGVPTGAPYQLLIDLEIAGPNTAGWHTVADAMGHPGPFALLIDEVRIYEH